jgi:hypothetical protein
LGPNRNAGLLLPTPASCLRLNYDSGLILILSPYQVVPHNLVAFGEIPFIIVSRRFVPNRDAGFLLHTPASGLRLHNDSGLILILGPYQIVEHNFVAFG